MTNKTMYDRAYYERSGLVETPFEIAGVLRPEMASAVVYALLGGREPEHILSVGCGTGIMEEFLERLGIDVTGADCSPAANVLYRGKKFVLQDCFTAVEAFEGDTIILCSTVEHIDAKEFAATMDIIRKRTVRLIITNRLEFHPIEPNGWDHVATINDAAFASIATGGVVVFQCGAHLVVDYGVC